MRVAYGKRDNIQDAIDKNVIPEGTLIITNDSDKEEELFFYTPDAQIKEIHNRLKFLTFSEAKAWAEKYDCVGSIMSIQNGTSWSLYIVQSDNTLSPVSSGDVPIEDIASIDGGTAFGVNN